MGRLREALVDGRLMSNIVPASAKDRVELEAWEKRSGVNLDYNDTIFGWPPTQIPHSFRIKSRKHDSYLVNTFFMHHSEDGMDVVWFSNPKPDDPIQEYEFAEYP